MAPGDDFDDLAAAPVVGVAGFSAELIGVIAHGLLNSMAVSSGAVRTVLTDPGLDDRRRVELLEMADVQHRHVMAVLADLVRGLPEPARELLDALSAGEL